MSTPPAGTPAIPPPGGWPKAMKPLPKWRRHLNAFWRFATFRELVDGDGKPLKRFQ